MRAGCGERFGQLVLQPAQIEAMREQLHELANIFTGVMIASGLMLKTLQQTPLGASASTLCGECERGRRLVGQLRNLLRDAAGEPPSETDPGSAAEIAPAPPRAKSHTAAAGGDGKDHDRRRR